MGSSGKHYPNSQLIDQTYIEKTEYTYKNLQNFWLVKKIKQTVKQDGHLIRSYRIQLNDYKVNIEN